MLSRSRVILNKSPRNLRRFISTVDDKEMEHFRQFAHQWWDVRGPLMLLHSMNEIRIPAIKEGLLATELAKSKQMNEVTANLRDFTILDAGCGAGILTEALARIESQITGLDANPDLIDFARQHAEKERFHHLEYVCSTIEEWAEKFPESYDMVVMSETIEHVTEKEQFLKAAVKCVKPGGVVFMSTNNKNWISTFVNIFLAENVLRIIPKDTHFADKFIARPDLEKMLEKENCKTFFRRGMFYNPITNRWTLSKHFDFIWYMIQAVKLKS